MKKNTYFLIGYFLILALNLPAQIQFEEHILIDNTTRAERPISVFTTDIDGDGDMDVLSASADDDKIAWYENLDGLGNFGIQQVITTIDAENPLSVYAADLDGDGDMDVLSASAADDKIAWYENLDGLGNFGVQQIISANTNSAQAVYAVDIDGDGDMDVLSASGSDNKIAWYENQDGLGDFGAQQIISTNAIRAESVYSIDIDGDGDMDVLSASRDDNKIAWYENENGLGDFGIQQIISEDAIEAQSVYSIDIDGDGDMDVLSASRDDNKIAWYENENGLGDFGIQQIISEDAIQAVSVYSIDVDGDGDQDVLSASLNDNKIAWYENEDGFGNFGMQQIISINANLASSVYGSDLDGDGDLDVLSTSIDDDRIAWYENEDGLGSFGEDQDISQGAGGACSVYASDVDGDGDMDILSASADDDRIAWYENLDGFGLFGFQQKISHNADFVCSVYTADLDGDGDQDLLSASVADDKVAWYENEDGLGDFGAEQILTINASWPRQVYAADLDSDGDQDVLSVSRNDDEIFWFENEDGLGDFGTEQILSTNADAPYTIYAADLNGDGGLDILSGSLEDDKIAWYENENGLGDFGVQQIIGLNTGNPYTIYAADLDGDGDKDILYGSIVFDKIAWYKNANGLGEFSGELIITTNTNGPNSVFAIDLDGDGDMDVLSASSVDNKVAYYENLDGLGNFGSQQIISINALEAVSVFATDLDSDGDIDVLSASREDGKIAWYENLGSPDAITSPDLPEIDFDIYPNPTTAIITIDTPTKISQIEIYNSLRQILLVNTNRTEIDLSVLAKGMYFCKIKNSDGHFGIRKVIKEGD